MSGTDEMRGIIRPTDVPAFGAYLLTFAPGTLLVDVAVALDRLDHAVPVHRVVLTSRSNQDHAGMPSLVFVHQLAAQRSRPALVVRPSGPASLAFLSASR